MASSNQESVGRRHSVAPPQKSILPTRRSTHGLWPAACSRLLFAAGGCVLLSTLGLPPFAAAQQPTAPPLGQNPPAAPAPPTTVNPKAQALLDRAVQAVGGPAFLKFKTMTTAGRVFAISDESTTGFAPFQSAVAYPDKRRFTFGQKKPITLINNGDRAWELDRMGVTHQLPEQRRRWKLTTVYGLENLLRVHIHDPGLLIQDGGVDFVDNAPVWIVAITEAGGGLAKLYLNKQNYLPVRVDYQSRNPQTKDFDDFADVYADYQLVQGVQTPMRIARFLNGERIAETFRRTARYDEPYAADYFEPPAR